jgi:hypothetical protein
MASSCVCFSSLSNKQADDYYAALGFEAQKEEFCHRATISLVNLAGFRVVFGPVDARGVISLINDTLSLQAPSRGAA